MYEYSKCSSMIRVIFKRLKYFKTMSLKLKPNINVFIFEDSWKFELVYDLNSIGGADVDLNPKPTQKSKLREAGQFKQPDLARLKYDPTVEDRDSPLTNLPIIMRFDTKSGKGWLNLPKNACNLRISSLEEEMMFSKTNVDVVTVNLKGKPDGVV